MNDNSTVEQVCKEGIAHLDPERKNGWSELFDRILAAHKREILVERKLASDHITDMQDKLAVMNGERKGIMKANERFAADNTRLRGEIAEKDAEIASLRNALRDIVLATSPRDFSKSERVIRRTALNALGFATVAEMLRADFDHNTK